MNKKIFATALLALATFVSTGVSAAVTYENSTDLSVAQGADSIVGRGATARANDIKLTINAAGSTGDLPKDGEIIVLLPSGLNFSGQPSFKVNPKISGAGLALKDSGTFGDSTLGEAYGVTPTVGVTLFDTNGDGGMDRAVAVAAANAGASDTITVSMDVTASATASIGLKKARVTVNGATGNVDIVKVQVADISKGVTSDATSKLIAAPQILTGNKDLGTTTPVVYITVPKGTKNGATVTLAPSGNVAWGQTSTITLTTITPFSSSKSVGSPLTGTLVISSVTNGTGATGLTQAITLTVANAGSAGLPNDTTVKLSVDKLTLTGTTTATTGEQGLKVAGTAKITGTAKFFNVAKNGSSAALGSKVVSIVKGSSAYQNLPNINITELFDGDATQGTSTITITAGTGLSFITPSTSGISVSGVTLGTTSTITATKVTLQVKINTTNTKTLVVSGLRAKATALGDLAVTVGGAKIDSSTGPAGDSVIVAKGVDVGTVSVTGPKELTKVGPVKVTTGTDAKVVLAETTYGSITTAGVSGSQVAFFSVTPSAGKLTGVSVATTSGWTGAPTFTNNTCAVESVGSKTFICKVSAESSSLTQPGTQTVTITAAVSGEGAVVGETISLVIGGNVGVSGTVDVATVLESTKTKVTGGITQVKEGLTESQKLSGFVISQAYDSSLKAGTFRLLAPQGVAFVTPTQGSLYSGSTATAILSTFNPNDTLRISTGAPTFGTSTLTIAAPNVLIASGVSGNIEISLLDGAVDGTAKTGITPETLVLGYADKTLDALSGGKDVSLRTDYVTTQEIKGGLVGDGYTVKSSSTPTVTVSVDGSVMTIKGVAAGAANITVTDSLGQSDVVAVTVQAGAAIPAAVKAAKGAGDRTGVTFGAGASANGGISYGTEFSVDDEVTIIATIGVDASDVGEAGAIHVAGKLADGSFVYLDEDGLFAEWDVSGLPGATIVTDELKASYTVNVVNATKLPVGEHRFALAYSTGAEVIYTGKALVITIAE